MNAEASVPTRPYLIDPERLTDCFPGEPSYRAAQLRQWLYRHPVIDPINMTNLPLGLRERIELWPFEVDAEQVADGSTTVKWLFRAPDGAAIEAVLMGYPDRTTLCISSQAGCAMACSFCATGQFGFERHLRSGEIVAQVAYADASLAQRDWPQGPRRVSNVVFMGMGEPLANYEQVRRSIDLLTREMGKSARGITVSTVGVAPGMRRLADEPWQVGLALSLHAADDAIRDRLVPLNRRYPIAELIAAAEEFTEKTGRRISIEWTLMRDINDDTDQARKLAAIARGLSAHVNLIRMNPTPLSVEQAPSESTVRRFLATLRDAGANATLRDTRGRDIDAACGQLRAKS